MEKIMGLIGLIAFAASQMAWAETIIKCQNSWGDISYANSSCPEGSTQLSKTTLKPYKTSQTISLQGLKKVRHFPKQQISFNEKAIFISRFSKVLTSMTPIKMKLSEFYRQAGVWPETFHAIKLNSKSLTSSLINKTSLARNGRIQVQLKTVFGKNKKLWLYPKSVMGDTQIEWHCYTNFSANWLTSKGMKLCESRDI